MCTLHSLFYNVSMYIVINLLRKRYVRTGVRKAPVYISSAPINVSIGSDEPVEPPFDEPVEPPFDEPVEADTCTLGIGKCPHRDKCPMLTHPKVRSDKLEKDLKVDARDVVKEAMQRAHDALQNKYGAALSDNLFDGTSEEPEKVTAVICDALYDALSKIVCSHIFQRSLRYADDVWKK